MPKTKDRNFCISTSNYRRYTQFISRYLFLRMTNMVILVKILYISKRTSKSMMAANFGQKINISMKLEQLERLRSEDTSAASWLPIPLSHIGSQVKRRQSQSHKIKKIAKISNFWILKWALHATHLLKLLDKMCKYEMDPMSILEDTERTRFYPQTDRRTDGRTDRRTRWYQYTPLSTSLKLGV